MTKQETTKKQIVMKRATSLGIEVKKSWTIKKLQKMIDVKESSVLSICKDVVDTAEKYKGCYFWSNTGNAALRRRQEFDNTVCFYFGGMEYQIDQKLDISCKNFYFSNKIYKNGIKTNLTAIKTVIKNLTH